MGEGMEVLLGNILASANQLILQRQAYNKYKLLTPIPGSIAPLFDDSTQQLRIEELPFLEHFLDIAEEFWQQRDAPHLRSGTWVEELDDGRQLSLEATAYWVDEQSILILEYLGDKYQKEASRLQSLRDKLLFNEQLEMEVVRRTAEIKEREEKISSELARQVKRKTSELQGAKEKAEASDRSKSTFLATMSHEIRTPMNGVLGAADLLAESTVLSDDDRELLGIIKTSGSLMLNIINDVLDFSRLNSGRIELERHRFRLGTLVGDIARVMRPIVLQKNLSLGVDMSPDMENLELMGDSERLKQVLVNLIGNATKFTERGYVRISAGVQNREAGQITLRVEVKDTGIGILKEHQDRLFDLFTQADSSTSRKYGGTGLGLSICKQIIELMGGIVGVESEFGQGSTFWFQLTLPEVAVGLDSIEPDMAPIDLATRPLDILVADDNVINQTILERMLERLGHRVSVVGNGRLAVEALKQSHFDVVFMDWMMPEMDGIQAAYEIRQMEHSAMADVVIIALTANSMAGHERQCMEAGMNTFVPKPASYVAVRQVLHKLFGDGAE